MHIFPFVVVVYILAVGLYGIVTSRHLVHQIMCLIVVQSSTYVLLLGIGYKTGAVAPYFYDIPVHTPAVDPVVQALALTDVVVEAAVTALNDILWAEAAAANLDTRAHWGEFQNGANLEGLANLAWVIFLSFEAEDRAAGHDSDVGQLRESADQALGQAIAQVLVVSVRRGVDEGQHGNGFDLRGG